MEELWRQASEMMSQRPLLWLPVLLADLLGYFVNLGAGLAIQALVVSRLQYHSAFGGGPLRAPVSPAAVQQATWLAMALTWSANFLRLLLYAAAFVVTAALVQAFRKRAEKPADEVLPALRRSRWGIASLALRALALYALAATLINALGRWMLAHGHKTLLASGWVETGAGLVLVAALAWLLAPAAVQVLAHSRPSKALARQAQLFAFALAVVALLLGRFVEINLRSVHIAFAPASYALGLTGSLIVALPYAVLFAGLGLLAWRVIRERASAFSDELEGR